MNGVLGHFPSNYVQALVRFLALGMRVIPLCLIPQPASNAASPPPAAAAPVTAAAAAAATNPRASVAVADGKKEGTRGRILHRDVVFIRFRTET